jgi:chloramphenicol-sensitive protein RarD
MSHEGRRGVLFAAGAYLLWGLLPVYWKTLQSVPAGEILAHRMVWSLGVVGVLLASRRRWGWIGAALRNRRTLLTFTASALLLSLNWFLYIWAVNADHVVETSLGYFINPLVNVVLGMVFLRERLRPAQVAAVLIAAAGVLYLTVNHGRLPWIALGLAFSFGFYGLLRKTAALSSLEGLALETVILFLPALLYLLHLEGEGRAAFGHAGVATTLLLAFAGAATAVPLLLFAGGARRISMTVLGVLQYIAPTLQLMLGVFVYGESLTAARLLGFCFVWVALLVFAGEGMMRRRSAAARSLAAGSAASLR